jgi:hypothetical protein
LTKPGRNILARFTLQWREFSRIDHLRHFSVERRPSFTLLPRDFSITDAMRHRGV